MDNNDAVTSQPLTEETTATKRHRQFTISLPFELFVEILCRLPVKSLLQFRCVCKSWNSLISDDTKFAKKHLRSSPTTEDFTRHHLIASSEFLLTSSSLLSVFNDVISPSTQLEHPLNNGNPLDFIVGSCDGIICLAIDQCFALLWNPLTGRFKKLPPLENSLPLSVEGFHKSYIMYGFGYDHFIGRYKVVAIFHHCNWIQNSYTTHVKVHTLGTDSWRTIQEEFPLGTLYNSSGRFVSGTLNWLVDRSFHCVIVSLDLGKECYRELLLPPGCGRDFLSLGVLRDCLSISAYFDCEFLYVWLMKEYGNEESWTILFSVTTSMEWDIFPTFPFVRNTLHVSENDEVLLELEIDRPSRGVNSMIAVYNLRDGTFKTPQIQNTMIKTPMVYVESLISPGDT